MPGDLELHVGPAGKGWVVGDSTELLASLPDASVHLVLSDIPYGVGSDDWDVLHANRNSALLGQSPAQRKPSSAFARRGKPINGWSSGDRAIPREYQAWCTTWASEWLRVLVPGGSALVFAGRRLAPRCVVALEDAGFHLKDQLAWTRPHAVFRAQRVSAVFERRADAARARVWRGWRVGNLRPRFEPILWFCKPYRRSIADNLVRHGSGAFDPRPIERDTGATDNVLDVGYEPGERRHHAAQKPERLLRALIELTTLPGQLVLDPFAGSGSTLVAARSAGRRYLGIEQDPATARRLARRLSP